MGTARNPSVKNSKTIDRIVYVDAKKNTNQKQNRGRMKVREGPVL